MDIKSIQEKLLDWYRENAKRFPWRDEPTPYHVWISEIMLQQTRIEAALPYYHRFITALPDIRSLAAVSLDELLKLWEGLGYYSRAKNLQKAAQIVMRDYGGRLPDDHAQLLSLPGIGEYTAGAIASIAYHIPVPAVDGNVMRVLSRLTNDDTDVLSAKGKKHFTSLATEWISKDDPGAFNQALMELGENVCLPNTVPNCSACPLREECEGFRNGSAAQLPTRIKKTQRRVEDRNVVLLISRGNSPQILLHRRPDKGLLGGMWEFPNTPEEDPLTCIPQTVASECVHVEPLSEAKHLFSHIEWRMRGYHYRIKGAPSLPDGYYWATVSELEEKYSVPGAFAVYKKLLNQLMNEES